MTRTRKILRAIGLALTLFAISLILLLFLATGTVSFELIAHLVAGFVFFLKDHLPRISTDHATWLPGIAAFLLAIALAHGMLKKAVHNKGGDWHLKSTICLALILPVLFAISFIVPGVILQLDSLGKIQWFDRSWSPRAMSTMRMRNLSVMCQLHAEDQSTGRYPDSLHDLGDLLDEGPADLPSDSAGPAEPPIYLGAGFPINTDTNEALMISPPLKIDGKWQRVVLKFNGSNELIADTDVEAWIERSLEKRR